MPALEALFDGKKPLTSIIRGGGVRHVDGVLLALCPTPLIALDTEGEEKGKRKDGDKKIENEPNIGHDAGPKALDTGQKGLEKASGTLTGV